MSTTDPAAKPKRKLGKLFVIAAGGLALVGGGVGAGLYASGGARGEPAADGPKLVPKSDQKRGGDEGEGHGGEATSAEGHGRPTPAGSGGDKFASNYYALEKDFTSNLRDSAHFVQIGIAVSTPYDDKVIDNLKTNEIAVRSAILLALGDTDEEQVFSGAGKKQLQLRLTRAINDTLKEKEGFGGVGNVYFTSFVVQ